MIVRTITFFIPGSLFVRTTVSLPAVYAADNFVYIKLRIAFYLVFFAVARLALSVFDIARGNFTVFIIVTGVAAFLVFAAAR